MLPNKGTLHAVKRNIERHHHLHHCLGYGMHAVAGVLAVAKITAIAEGLVAIGAIHLFIVAIFDKASD